MKRKIVLENNVYIIQSKDINLINKSSSGGIFAELARYILSKGGVVFGCSMERTDDGFDVKHIYVEDEKDLYKLQGSKYVQSRICNTIKEAKAFLEEGRLVLFSGTPCQIAGLKAYLKQDYDNLLTVDLSCEGTPPLNIFNDYIKYLENNVIKSKIIDFKFRSKKHFGWSTSGFVAIYKKGNKIKEKILPQNLSSYFTYFLQGYILQERCFSCKYTGLNRISDITIADAWGVEKEYPDILKKKFNKNRGISFVLVNSSKGKNYLQNIKSVLDFLEININKLRKYNHPLRYPSIKPINKDEIMKVYKYKGYEGLEKLFKQNLGYKYYYYIIKNYMPKFIKNIVNLSVIKKTDCLLMTAHGYPNYGSMLASYSLQKAISNKGYTVKLINYMNSFGVFKIFEKKYLSLTNRCVNLMDFINLNKLSNVFILGSDNLINYDTNPIVSIAISLLNFTSNDKKKLMISGSIGDWTGNTRTVEEYNYIKYLLEKFDYISVREIHGKEVFENIYNLKADWINDPVFYLDKQDYLELIKDIKQDYSNKIMQYILYPKNETAEIVNYYKEKLNIEIEKFDGNENVGYFSRHKNKSVENWLSAVINSKLVITDSFHCVAFCLIFNKNFVFIKNRHATVRFTSLFKRLGVNIPIIESVDDLKDINLNYDKEVVNKNLSEIKNFANDKILEILCMATKPHKINIEMEEYNKSFLKNGIPWYKRNKFLYLFLIKPFIIPLIQIKKYSKFER